ncbi:MAG: ABC transporter ATP-binding protein, partial [Bacteroidales bacterium]|nr:ABC transporter ATP-binding protein [Bacteroidales bacterium]
MMQSFINLSNISTGYISGSKRKAVTSGLNGNLYKGELTCLLGPNGMGKSTLLRTLSAFQPSLKGQISVDGRCLGEYSTGELARTISVVLTERPAIPNISVEEFVALGRSPYTGFFGKLTDSDSQIVEKSIEQVGVTNLKDRQWLSLSDGEKQKVMIAKSLAQETPVIFLDEP